MKYRVGLNILEKVVEKNAWGEPDYANRPAGLDAILEGNQQATVGYFHEGIMIFIRLEPGGKTAMIDAPNETKVIGKKRMI
jgi:hypothetical protein